MRTFALVALLAITSCSAPPAPANAEPPQAGIENAPRVPVRTSYRVQQQGGGLGIFIDEAAVFYEVGSPPSRIWVLERRRRDQKMGVVTMRADWVDGRTCPALEKAVAEIGRLPPVAMAGLDTRSGPSVSDASDVTLIGPAARESGANLVLRRDARGIRLALVVGSVEKPRELLAASDALYQRRL